MTCAVAGYLRLDLGAPVLALCWRGGPLDRFKGRVAAPRPGTGRAEICNGKSAV